MDYVITALMVLTPLGFYLYSKKPQKVPVGSKQPTVTFHSDNCPLCLCQMNLGLQTSCGHQFCGQCILYASEKYFQLKCPLCRTLVIMLFPYFKQEQAPEDLNRKIARFNLLNNPQRTLLQTFKNFHIILMRALKNISIDQLLRSQRSANIFLFMYVYSLIPTDLFQGSFGIFWLAGDLLFLVCAMAISSIAYMGRDQQRTAQVLQNF